MMTAAAFMIGTAQPAAASTAPAKPLAGYVVGIDPGHNGRNWSNPTFINHKIWNGREWEACNTTGTSTNAGYSEAAFNFAVATYLKRDLRAAGAKVVMTRTTNNGVGPCVNKRAQILNKAHVDVAIDIHGDGGPSSGRGFTILRPVADGPNDKVIKPSFRYAKLLRTSFRKTGMPISDYYGTNGMQNRNDLAGLNLTKVPQLLLECGNMRNATDAKLMTSHAWQKRAAHAIKRAMTHFLKTRSSGSRTGTART